MRTLHALLLIVGAVLLGSCVAAEGFPKPIPGSAYRIGQPMPAEKSDINVNIFTDYNDCANAKIDDVDSCVPLVDRRAGEVRLAFDLRDPGSSTTVYHSLAQDQMALLHDKARQADVELIPHDPIRSGQLFILLIDGSCSMYENNSEPINKVYKALLDPNVIESFYPEAQSKTGVVLIRFSSGDPRGLDGGPPKILTTPRQYRRMVEDHLIVGRGGMTHLYEAVSYAVGDLLKAKGINDFVMAKSASPTIVALTDGFNHQQGSDTCATNVPRLQEALDDIKEARRAQATIRPTLHAVGLGTKYQDRDKPEGLKKNVSPVTLCGSKANEPINDLARGGKIDHISLAWLAETAQGSSFVRSSSSGLAEVFAQAASVRYRWYEVRYRVPDAFFHRKGFDVQINLKSFGRGFTTVRIHPSAWLDAPPGTKKRGEAWVSPNPLRLSFTIVMPILGALVFLNFLGAATFNARRAIFRRMKPRK